MWCRWRPTITAITFGVTASLVSYEFVAAQQRYYYTPGEFRVVMRGLGYDIPETGPLTDEATQKAIRDFQQRYGLPADGIAGPKTQEVAAQLMRNLHGSLNLVVQPVPPLPRNQFYTELTRGAVEQFQRKFNLPENGVADLKTRSRLDQEARQILDKQPRTPGATPSPSPTPEASPQTAPEASPSPSPTPEASPQTAPEASPTRSPRATPRATPSP
jgi:peptidoglycan hydrolase-like protein with peptidoglycan-binding domain